MSDSTKILKGILNVIASPIDVDEPKVEQLNSKLLTIFILAYNQVKRMKPDDEEEV